MVLVNNLEKTVDIVKHNSERRIKKIPWYNGATIIMMEIYVKIAFSVKSVLSFISLPKDVIVSNEGLC